MTNRLFVGNLAWEARASDIRTAAELLGFVVTDVFVPVDRSSGRPRGFAFLELDSDDAAERAATALDGELLAGRPLRVDLARSRD
ncbi:RNA recognition motif domain-containing protein [Engelhardtia mirabilis]|uniref:RNA recognition motif (RRM, RBD, or RNP domain) n=1 Tax=Engelhardtia mirabilis TaxID=2528011 RepID=A0A518BGB9_9BACT|nr:RNA recognition motif (RRM, RBD, or RNP domain) [Planctomycetes bacterium Pla133]QDV00354.1 RNA recognition motif (RRM, RBD, or RNP domain) [Planctomycetes bacterium Pla86]